MSWPLKSGLLLITFFMFAAIWTATDSFRKKYPPDNYLAMTFAHADHAKQQCVACHHNYQDGTGQGLCLDCHQTKPGISFLIRQQFHGLCMGCHNNIRNQGDKAGPLRNCSGCHTADDRP